MKLVTLERQTGDYGTVNKDDTVIVSDSVGEELLALGTFKKSAKSEDMATPEEAIERKVSGISTEPAGFDGTEREAKNTEGRNLVQQDGVTDAAIEDKEKAQAELVEQAKSDAEAESVKVEGTTKKKATS